MADAPIPRRTLGKTGVTISALGMGGHRLCDAGSLDECVNLVAKAIDHGITCFDNCRQLRQRSRARLCQRRHPRGVRSRQARRQGALRGLH